MSPQHSPRDQQFSAQRPSKPEMISLYSRIPRNSSSMNLSNCSLNVFKLLASCDRNFHYISAFTWRPPWTCHLLSCFNDQLSPALSWNRQWVTDLLCVVCNLIDYSPGSLSVPSTISFSRLKTKLNYLPACLVSCSMLFNSFVTILWTL